jgi:hypothetical protein
MTYSNFEIILDLLMYLEVLSYIWRAHDLFGRKICPTKGTFLDGFLLNHTGHAWTNVANCPTQAWTYSPPLSFFANFFGTKCVLGPISRIVNIGGKQGSPLIGLGTFGLKSCGAGVIDIPFLKNHAIFFFIAHLVNLVLCKCNRNWS